MSGSSTRDRFTGTWKLVGLLREHVDSGQKDDLFGPGATGYLNYTPDGRMMIIHLLGSRTKPAGSTPTPQEAHVLIKSMVSYAGTYTVSDNKVTHDIEVSWNEAWTGLRQTRTFALDGNRMTLTTPPQPDPLDGKMCVRRLTWEKVSSP